MGAFTIGTRVIVLNTRRYGRIKNIAHHPQDSKKFVYEVKFDSGERSELFFAKDLMKASQQ